ncbi:hypothetical protein ACFSQJ_11420 [Croceitalea marina]|uniref:Uncharacterized protein n=1 Tax=Croceitalea marina TaxID=1775166 RepID=A0ABW5N000_9FLAO
MNDTTINLILGLCLGLAGFAFVYMLVLVIPIIQDSLKKKKTSNRL